MAGGDEFFAALLGAGASHVGGKAAERFSKRYGLLITGIAVAGLWYTHHKVKKATGGPPAVGLEA